MVNESSCHFKTHFVQQFFRDYVPFSSYPTQYIVGAHPITPIRNRVHVTQNMVVYC